MTAASDPALVDRAARLAAEAGLADAPVCPLDRGLSADLYTVGPPASPRAVVKLQRGFAGKVWAEVGALAFAAGCGVSLIPPVLLARPKHDPPALVLGWLAHATDLAHSVRPAAAAEALGGWLAGLHERVVPPGDVKMSSDPLALPDRLLRQAASAAERLAAAPGASETAAALVPRGLAWLRERIATLDWPHERRLVHRDLRPDNVLVDAGGGLAGVVDLEHACAAHPAWDVAKLTWWFFDRFAGFESPFRRGYTAVRAWPDPAFCQLFRVFEATTLLAYFDGKHPVYPAQAAAQLEADLAGGDRPPWGDGDRSTLRPPS